MEFDCFKIGVDGFMTYKPEENAGEIFSECESTQGCERVDIFPRSVQGSGGRERVKCGSKVRGEKDGFLVPLCRRMCSIHL